MLEDTHMHKCTHSLSQALHHFSTFPARRSSPDAATQLLTRPQPLFFVTYQLCDTALLPTENGIVHLSDPCTHWTCHSPSLAMTNPVSVAHSKTLLASCLFSMLTRHIISSLSANLVGSKYLQSPILPSTFLASP
jgi:hypothetical protein